MDEQPETLHEAVGIFTSEKDLQVAIDELFSWSFHRAELSLLAGEHAVNEKLGGSFARSTLLRMSRLLRELHTSHPRPLVSLKTASWEASFM